jgi:ubiquinone/menaquinone biosynthesis C-methylase UbiE
MLTRMTTNQPASTDAKDRVRAQYNSVGDAYVKSVGHATGSDLQRMVELAAPQPTERLLDIATGGGHVARVFAPHVAEVVASDLTPGIIEHAGTYLAGLGLANVTMALADAEQIPFEDGSFDIVTCRIAPHHFPDPAAFVQEAARVLRRGGRFVLVDSTVPEGETGAFFNRFEKLRDPSHVESLTIGAWTGLIAAAGLVLQAAETFTKTHDFADWTSRSRMSDEDRATLERMMLDATEPVRQHYRSEIADGRLVAFTDTKTLFVANR